MAHKSSIKDAYGREVPKYRKGVCTLSKNTITKGKYLLQTLTVLSGNLGFQGIEVNKIVPASKMMYMKVFYELESSQKLKLLILLSQF